MAYNKKSKKTKKHRQVDAAVIHVKSSFNNVLVTATTTQGDVLVRCGAGQLNFKGSRKGTPYAASQVGAYIARELEPYGVKVLECALKGPGSGRDSVVRTLQSSGYTVTELRDVTPLPHNGCRPPKKRRV